MKKFLRIIIAIIMLLLWAILMMPASFLTLIIQLGFWVYEKPVPYKYTWKSFGNEFFALYRMLI